MKRICPVAGVAVGLLLIPSTALATKPADTVVRGGTIRTFDAKFSVVHALAVRDGRIVYAGGTRGVRRYIGARTNVQNLHGRTVMPGLSDAHIHVLPGGQQLVTCNLQYAPSPSRSSRRRSRSASTRTRPPRRATGSRSSTGTGRRCFPPGPTRRRRRSTRCTPTGRSSCPRATGTPRCSTARASRSPASPRPRRTRRPGASTATPAASRPASSRKQYPATRRPIASSRMPVGWPLASRSMRPVGGSGVAAVMPATWRPLLLSSEECPSLEDTMMGRSVCSASSVAFVASVPAGSIACRYQLTTWSQRSPWRSCPRRRTPGSAPGAARR